MLHARLRSLLLAAACGAPALAAAQSPSADPPAVPAGAPAGGSDADAAALAEALAESEAAAEAEVIEVRGRAPAPPGAVSLDAAEARAAPGALGEPLRALAALPGVATSVAAVGYPVIRGTLPGESRFSFDGIELPMLYHLLLGNQVLHPSFLGSLELRAGGHGAEQGHLLGGLVALSPADVPARPRTELRATPIEVGAFHAQRLSPSTDLAAAARAGTLSLVARAIDSRTQLHHVDQQARLVHRLRSGDELSLTSLGAYDHVDLPPDPDEIAIRLGFHRLDARWSRGRGVRRVQAGVQSELDVLQVRSREGCAGSSDPACVATEERTGASAAGVRPYVSASFTPSRWLVLRGGVEGRARWLGRSDAPLFPSDARYLRPARRVTSAGAWLAADARWGRFEVTPGLRVDTYRARFPLSEGPRLTSLDPRLAVTARIAEGVRAELAAGAYAAPPQATLVVGGIAIGPLPATDGTGANTALSTARQVQASLRAELGAGFDASAAAYARRTRYALDFGMVGKDFRIGEVALCAEPEGSLPDARYYDRDVPVLARGVELMVRRAATARVSGWLSYSLAKIDRELPIGRRPHDYDQRHTLNAAVQARVGRWTLGVGGHLHTGRPAIYPRLARCMSESYETDQVIEDPDALRRLPLTWRVDLRAERAFRFDGWRMRLFFELQNAAAREEALGFGYDEVTRSIRTNALRLPVPSVGLDAEL